MLKYVFWQDVQNDILVQNVEYDSRWLETQVSSIRNG